MVKQATKRVCGLKEPRNGEKRGSAEYCFDKKQIRYYGLVPVDPEILIKKPKKRTVLDEQLALKKLQDEAVVIINKAKHFKMIIKEKSFTDKQKEKAKRDLDRLVEKSEDLQKRLAKQKKILKKAQEKTQEKARAPQKKRRGKKTD